MFIISVPGFKFEDTRSLMTEIIKGPDRSLAIVGGALVEYVLTNTMLEYLHSDKKLTERLFHPSGALGSFGSKISLAKLIGLCGPRLHSDLKIMKNVRNRFAHELHLRTFEDDKIAGWCRQLSLCDSHTTEATPPQGAVEEAEHWKVGFGDRERELSTPRGRFLATISVCTFALSDVQGRKAPNAPL